MGPGGVLKRSRARYPFVRHAFADGGHAGRLVDWARRKTHITLQIVRRNASRSASRSCPAAGSSRGRSPGSSRTAASRATTSSSPPSPRP